MSRRLALIAAIAAVVACAAGFAATPRAMLQSWLFAWLFALGVSLGALANLMVHRLTGGRWGETLRPPLVAAARLIPFVALLFVPLFAGFRLVFPWAEAGAETHASWWLNEPFFLARSVAWLVLWSVLARLWLRADRSDGGTRGEMAKGVSAAGLVIYAFSVSLAAYDWIVSLEHAWYSSGFGLVVAVSQMLAGAAFGVAAAAWGQRDRPADEGARQRSHDLGNLLLMYVLMWAWLAFMQFLIIWAANLPREISWYLPRLQTSWFLLGGLLAAGHFALPLLVLLSRRAKRAPLVLGLLAAALLCVNMADVFWMVMPAFRRSGFGLAWTDAAASATVLGAWGAGWWWLRRTAAAAGRTAAYG